MSECPSKRAAAWRHRSRELTLCIGAEGCIQPDALVCDMGQMMTQKRLEESLKEKGEECLAQMKMRNVETEQSSQGQKNPQKEQRA